MIDDQEGVHWAILRNNKERLYRLGGGHAPADWTVRLVAAGCGLAGLLVMIPFAWGATPRLRFAPFTPIALDVSVSLAGLLVFLVMFRWAAPSQRRQALLIGVSTPTVLTAVMYLFSGWEQDLILWTMWHLMDASGTLLVIIIALWWTGDAPVLRAKNQSPAQIFGIMRIVPGRPARYQDIIKIRHRFNEHGIIKGLGQFGSRPRRAVRDQQNLVIDIPVHRKPQQAGERGVEHLGDPVDPVDAPAMRRVGLEIIVRAVRFLEDSALAAAEFLAASSDAYAKISI